MLCVHMCMWVHKSPLQGLVNWEAWHAAIHGVAKSWIRLSDWTELNWTEGTLNEFFKKFFFKPKLVQWWFTQWSWLHLCSYSEKEKQTFKWYCFSLFKSFTPQGSGQQGVKKQGRGLLSVLPSGLSGMQGPETVLSKNREMIWLGRHKKINLALTICIDKVLEWQQNMTMTNAGYHHQGH